MLIGVDEIVKRTLARLDTKRKGIILFHDTETGTAKAVPLLLTELKRLGYRVVHMMPNGEGIAALKPPAVKTMTTSERDLVRSRVVTNSRRISTLRQNVGVKGLLRHKRNFRRCPHQKHRQPPQASNAVW
jgi:hypothetical protein